MGFLDLLSGKKKNDSSSANIPPPAPGPGKTDLPKPPEQKNELGGLNIPEQKSEFKLNDTPEKNKPNTETINGLNKEIEKEEFKGFNFPDLDRSKNINQEIKPPTFQDTSKNDDSKNSNQFPNSELNSRFPNNNNNNNNMKSEFDLPNLDLPKFPGVQENINQEDMKTSDIDFSRERNQTERKSYLSDKELQLNNLREKLHRPEARLGVDSSNIGNVESTLKKKTRVRNGPLFIEINNYKRVLHSMDEMRRDISESQEFVLKLDEFNDKKNNEYERWKKTIEYIHSKLNFVDKTLFKE